MDYREINRQALLQESKEGLINRCPNLDDDQKASVIAFLQKHPQGYDSMIDWNKIKTLQWEDFQRMFDAAENNARNKRSRMMRAAEAGDFEKLFSRPDVVIMGENDEWIYVSPLSHEAAVWMDSIECGGGGARWCIGTKDNDSYWMNYLKMGNSFIMAFRKDFKDHDKENDVKYMIRYNVICDNEDDPCCEFIGSPIGDVWDQVETGNHPVFKLRQIDNVTTPYGLEQDEIREYARRYWQELFRYNPDASDIIISEMSGYSGLQYNLNTFLAEDDFRMFSPAGVEREMAIKEFGEEAFEQYEEENEDWAEEIEDNFVPTSTWDIAASSHATIGFMVSDYDYYIDQFQKVNTNTMMDTVRFDYTHYMQNELRKNALDKGLSEGLNAYIEKQKSVLSDAVVGYVRFTDMYKSSYLPRNTEDDQVEDIYMLNGLANVRYAQKNLTYVLDYQKVKPFMDELLKSKVGLDFSSSTLFTNVPEGTSLRCGSGLYDCTLTNVWVVYDTTRLTLINCNIGTVHKSIGCNLISLYDSTIGMFDIPTMQCIEAFGSTVRDINGSARLVGAIGDSHLGKTVKGNYKMAFTRKIARELVEEGMDIPVEVSILDDDGNILNLCKYVNGKFISMEGSEVPLDEALKRFLNRVFKD